MNVQSSRTSQTSKQLTDIPRLGLNDPKRGWSKLLRGVERNWALWVALMILAMIAGSVF